MDFVRLREPELTRFATGMAIAESARMPDWRQWPVALQRPDDDAVATFREANAQRVDLHRWLQYEMHRQLGEVAVRARTLGMEIGVYQDLAIGTSGGGSDTWSYPDLFLRGACVGAPPDPYSAVGQNWGLPPMDPRALRRQGYRYWIQLLRRGFEHAGALRIDHVMGLFRTFWIPDGATGKEGAYVRFPSHDLLGILALESVRHDALVVGEDLGVVPKEVPPALRKWGILSSKVLYFERDRRGFRPAKRYPALSLATANTHDMAPIAGFWSERDIDLRKEVGLVSAPAEVQAARRERASDKTSLLELLKVSSPPSFDVRHFVRTLTAGVHEFLCSSPARLVGLSFDDLVAEQEPVNVPGVGPDKYPSWRRRTRITVEEAAWSFEVDDAMRCAARRRRT
jgi:4-alpha-glucanotransferase